MIDGRTFYEVLEVDVDASQEEIKKSFRRLSKRYHPDVCTLENAQELFDNVQKANDVLSNKELKEEYDKRLKSSEGMTFEDLYSTLRTGPKMKGQDIAVTLEVSYEALASGETLNVSYKKDVHCDCTTRKRCTNCGGMGTFLKVKKTILGEYKTRQTCPVCKGEGVYTEHEEECDGDMRRIEVDDFSVDLTGVNNGDKLFFAGRGNAGRNGGMNGNLHVIVNAKQRDNNSYAPHAFDPNSLTKEVPVTIHELFSDDGVKITLPNREVTTIVLSKRNNPLRNTVIIPNSALGSGNEKGSTYLDFRLIIEIDDEEKQKKLLKFWRDEIENN